MNSCFRLLKFMCVLFSMIILKLGSSSEKKRLAIAVMFLFTVAEHMISWRRMFSLAPALRCYSINLQILSSWPASRKVSSSSITNDLTLLRNNFSPSRLYWRRSMVVTRASIPCWSLLVSILCDYPEYKLKNRRGTS